MIIPLLVYALPTSIGVFVILWLSKKKLDGDLLTACLVPICVWLVLVLLNDKGKTLTNFVLEPLILAGLVCILVALHSIVHGREFLSGRNLGIVTVASSTVIVLGVFFFMPALPE
jgi:hypothetical protein